MAVSLTAVAATAVLGAGLAVHGYRVAAAGRACSFTVGQVTGITWMATFGRVWTWVAVVAMLLGLVGLFRFTRNAGRASGSQDPALQKGERDGSR